VHQARDARTDTFGSALFRQQINLLAGPDSTFLLPKYESLVVEYKESQLKAARRYCARARSDRNSLAAVLVKQRASDRLFDSLVPSASTLIAIPAVLMDHWQVG
jgi:hypothetical protein